MTRGADRDAPSLFSVRAFCVCVGVTWCGNGTGLPQLAEHSNHSATNSSVYIPPFGMYPKV